jgi:hypothetical protein
MSEHHLRPIPPELVAAKCAAIGNHELPRALHQMTERPRVWEVPMFLQGMSLLPGGLWKFTEWLLNEFPERLGTPTMRDAKSKRYTIEQKIAIFGELPRSVRPEVKQEADDSSVAILVCSSGTDIQEMEARDRRVLAAALRSMEAEQFAANCRDYAQSHLPELLYEICTDKSRDFSHPEGSWYFYDLFGALIEAMDRYAANAMRLLAKTGVSDVISETADRAVETRIAVQIRGESRYGKTESLATWCAAHPAKLRWVEVPPSNSMQEFIQAVAKSLGMDTSYGSNPTRLRAKVSYIIEHTGIGFAFDEAARLLPRTYTATTAPQRLEWIRAALIDRERPVVIAVTPCWFDEATTEEYGTKTRRVSSPLEKFARVTGYAVEQFSGRFERVRLPDELSESDVLNVVRAHFPEITNEADLLEIGACANGADSYLYAIELLSKRARHKAKAEGARLSIQLIKREMALMWPSEDQAAPVNTRLTTPKGSVKASGQDSLATCSFRGGGPQIPEAELISVEG